MPCQKPSGTKQLSRLRSPYRHPHHLSSRSTTTHLDNFTATLDVHTLGSIQRHAVRSDTARL